MKLIIDISDEEYKTLSKMSEKEKVNELSYYERVIANGIPILNEGDLISRSELKKAYFNAINETSIGEVSIIDLINNAPTVAESCKELHEVATERPQTIGCFNCKHETKMVCEEPCVVCNSQYSEWRQKE